MKYLQLFFIMLINSVVFAAGDPITIRSLRGFWGYVQKFHQLVTGIKTTDKLLLSITFVLTGLALLFVIFSVMFFFRKKDK